MLHVQAGKKPRLRPSKSRPPRLMIDGRDVRSEEEEQLVLLGWVGLGVKDAVER